MDGIEFTLTAIVVSVYVLIGSFWAWVLGMAPITLPWFSVVILWPLIGLMIAFVGLIVASLLSHIFSVRIVRERR